LNFLAVSVVVLAALEVVMVVEMVVVKKKDLYQLNSRSIDKLPLRQIKYK
jgi:hypothetical protein